MGRSTDHGPGTAMGLPLIQAYVGQGLRADLEQLEKDPVTALVESLKRHGVSEEVLQEALAEVAQR